MKKKKPILKSQLWLYRELNKTPGQLQKLTGIPAPLFARLKAGKSVKFSLKSTRKLKADYQHDNYELLRKYGAGRQEAKRNMYQAPTDINRQIIIMKNWAERRLYKARKYKRPGWQNMTIESIREQARRWNTVIEDYENFDNT